MNALEKITVGMTGKKIVTVTHDMTVQHFVSTMPAVYATPIMILHMEMVSTASIVKYLPDGYVSVGMEVNVKHLAATPVGREVHLNSRVLEVSPKSVLFAVEAWDGDRKIGEGAHRRGIVATAAFNRQFGAS